MQFDLKQLREELYSSTAKIKHVDDLVVMRKEHYDKLFKVFKSFRMVRNLLSEYASGVEITRAEVKSRVGKCKFTKEEKHILKEWYDDLWNIRKFTAEELILAKKLRKYLEELRDIKSETIKIGDPVYFSKFASSGWGIIDDEFSEDIWLIDGIQCWKDDVLFNKKTFDKSTYKDKYVIDKYKERFE